jgi:hypothetical protein
MSDQKKGNPTTYYAGQIVDPQTLEFERSIKDEKQAHAVCKKLLSDNRARLSKDSAIMRKYNDEQPWDATKLKSAGQGWRNNRSTGFLSSLVRRGTHPYIQTIDDAKTLTSSQLKKSDVKSRQKSEEFQKETTKTIRQWKNWHTFKSTLILEDVLFGHAATAYTDEYDWHPRFHRNDDIIFPDGCTQNSEDVPIFMLRQRFQIHELAQKVFNYEAAQAAGWRINNVVEAINNAKPDIGQKGTIDDQRRYMDTIRESTLGYSYQNGVKVIKVYHLFAREASGKVTHWIVDEDSGDLLFLRWDRFESMDSILSLFSIEVGNGKFYGTKGAGRMLYNTHVAIEQARNLIADNLYLKGLLILRATGTGKKSAAITVTHPVCVIGENYEAVDAKFDPNVDAFFSLDTHMSSIAEQMMGLFMPAQQLNAEGEKRTASEVNYVASIEQQIRAGVLSRFWGQFLLLIWQMQKRMYSADNIKKAYKIWKIRQMSKVALVAKSVYDFMVKIGKNVLGIQPELDIVAINPEAIQAIINLLDQGLEPEEIYELAQCSPTEFTADPVSSNQMGVDAVVARYKGDPTIRQDPLKKMDIASKLGYQIADELIIPEEDQSVEAIAIRQQILEFNAMLAGDPIPVAGSDNHMLHMGALMAKAQQIMPSLTPQSVTKQTLDSAKNIVQHFDDHLQGALQQGAKDEIKPFQEFSAQAHALLDAVAPGLSGPQNQLNLPAGAMPASQAMNQDAGLSQPPADPAQAGTVPLQPTPPSEKMPLKNGPTNLTPKVSP